MGKDNHIIKNYLEQYKPSKKYYYSENDPIRNSIHYWIKCKNLYKKGFIVENDKLWGEEIEKEYHSEFNNLYNYSFDTILSFWYPLEFYIRWKDKDKKYTRWNGRVTQKNLSKIQNHLDNYLKPVTNEEIEVYELLKELAFLSSTRANVMKIPKYVYNTKVNFNYFHYEKSNDQIWLFLYKIINDDDCKCFENNKQLINWINEEKLYICFEDNNVKNEIKYYNEYKKLGFKAIKPEIDSDNFVKEYKNMLKMYINFINDRDKELSN